MGISDWLKKKSEQKSVGNILDDLMPLIQAAAELGAARNDAEADLIAERRVRPLQRKFVDDLTLWNSVPIERTFSEVVLPALVAYRGTPHYATIVNVTYTVCQNAAHRLSGDIRSVTPPDVLEIADANWRAQGSDPLRPFNS